MADDGMIMLPASGEQSILRGPVQRRKDVAATSDPTRRASPLHFAANAEAEASMVAGGTHVQYSPPLLPVGVAAPGLDLPHASSSNALHVPTPLRHGAFDSMMLPQISATFDGTSGHVSPDPHPYHIAFGAGAIWDLHTSHTEIHSQPAFSFTAPGENSAFRNYVSPPHTTRVSSCPIPGIDPGISHIRRYTAEPTGGLPLLDQRIPASRTASWPNPEEYCPSSSTYCAW
ncbi:hypothetical protein BV20DRAFT_1053438 [Pilatotrama ljubarskyi]|nr:hypothetical protein BV20DRAFT_1053438 [Pilatotrama ljubarskyi]